VKKKEKGAHLNQDLTIHMLAASLGTNQEIKEGLALDKTSIPGQMSPRARNA
jgi:hypothetical protein